MEGLHASLVNYLIGFLSQACLSLFRAFNQTWEDFFTTMTVCQRSHLSENHFAHAFIFMQDQNFLCEDLLMIAERYRTEVDEYNKKVNDLSSKAEPLEAEVERWTKELKELRKNPEAEKLKADVHRLASDLTATRARAQESVDKLQ
ncbi:hypothetical protein Fot_07701 [Forsythia ovata]|uniref:Uncharacterized protein n=1 Tax=Forsythia ovata TaxID=205694 RepID=A0ABD1WWK4_9LAMI